MPAWHLHKQNDHWDARNCWASSLPSDNQPSDHDLRGQEEVLIIRGFDARNPFDPFDIMMHGI